MYRMLYDFLYCLLVYVGLLFIGLLYGLLLQMLQDCMQVEEAMELYKKAISLQPNIASTYVYLGYVATMVMGEINLT